MENTTFLTSSSNVLLRLVILILIRVVLVYFQLHHQNEMGWEEYSIFVQTGGILTQMFFNSTFQRLNDERRAYVEKARLERLAIKARGAEESQHNELFPSPTNYEVDVVNEDEDVDEDDYVSNELCEDWCNSYYTSETMCIANESMSSHSNLDDLNESLKLVEGSATHVSPNSTNTTCTSVNPNSTNTTSDAAEYDNMTTNNPYINAVVEATIVETKSPALNIPEDTRRYSKWPVESNCTEKIHENRSVPDQNAFTILSKDVDILNAKVSKGSQPYRVSMRSINPVQRDLVVAQNINTAYIILFAIILALVVGAMVYLLLYHWEIFFPERTRFSKRYPNSPKYGKIDKSM